MYKHVAKQRRLVNSNRELHLSDEDSSGNSDSSSEAHSSDDDSSSGGTGGGGSDTEEESDDEAGEQDSDGSEAGEQEEEDAANQLLPPPAHFPTALEATIDPIAFPEDEDNDDADGVEVLGKEGLPVCCVCPNKTLKKGTMLEIHITSKDHLRRLSRFTTYVSSPDFPAEHASIDARSIAALLDQSVFDRLSRQSQFGGPSSKAASLPSTSTAAAIQALAATPLTQHEIHKQRHSNRATLRIAKQARRTVQRLARKAARGVKKQAKVIGVAREAQGQMKKGEETEKAVLRKRKIVDGEILAVVAADEGSGKKIKRIRAKDEVKPSKEEIELRQEAKMARRAEESSRDAERVPKTEAERAAKKAAKKERKALALAGGAAPVAAAAIDIAVVPAVVAVEKVKKEKKVKKV